LAAIRVTGARFDEDGTVSQLQRPQNLPKGTVGVEQVGSEVEEQLPLGRTVGTVTGVLLDVEWLHLHPFSFELADGRFGGVVGPQQVGDVLQAVGTVVQAHPD
jgi:hypothetical protein